MKGKYSPAAFRYAALASAIERTGGWLRSLPQSQCLCHAGHSRLDMPSRRASEHSTRLALAHIPPFPSHTTDRLDSLRLGNRQELETKARQHAGRSMGDGEGTCLCPGDTLGIPLRTPQ